MTTQAKKTIVIKGGPKRGTWQQMQPRGFGPDGSLSGWVKLGKHGRPLTCAGVYMNLNPQQVAQLEGNA